MNVFEKFQTVIILSAVGLGLLLGQFTFLKRMLYGLFLTIPLEYLKAAFKNRKFSKASTINNFVWIPILAWGLGAIFLANHPALWIGFIMLMTAP